MNRILIQLRVYFWQWLTRRISSKEKRISDGIKFTLYFYFFILLTACQLMETRLKNFLNDKTTS